MIVIFTSEVVVFEQLGVGITATEKRRIGFGVKDSNQHLNIKPIVAVGCAEFSLIILTT
jgi:hypothetical protein